MKQLLTITTDLLIIYSCIMLSFFFLGEQNYLTHFEENLNAFYVISPMVGILYLIFMYAFGLYSSFRRSWGDVIYTVFLISVSLTISIMASCFFIRNGAFAFPRSVIFLSSLFYFIFLTCWRLIIWKLERKKHGIKKVIAIGPDAVNLAEIIKNKHKDIYTVTTTCSETDPRLESLIQKCQQIFLTAGIEDSNREKIFYLASNYGKSVCFVPEYRDVSIMSASLQKTDDIPTFHIEKMGLTLEERFVKRMIDLLLGGIGFIIALPVGLITAFFIKLDGGPVFYTQERLTRNGKVFKVFKFRSMVPNAEKLSGPVQASDNDPRITKVGKIMRATRLDELPQILNILVGDMSIVGPRPERPFFCEQFEKEVPQYRGRHKVKAGLTGLAQVEGKYNTSFDDKLRYDLLYISRYSLLNDLLIILQTVKILFLKESTEGMQNSISIPQNTPTTAKPIQERMETNRKPIEITNIG